MDKLILGILKESETVNGAEAEDIRKSIEIIIEEINSGLYINVEDVSLDLQNALDKVDARDSLEYLLKNNERINTLVNTIDSMATTIREQNMRWMRQVAGLTQHKSEKLAPSKEHIILNHTRKKVGEINYE